MNARDVMTTKVVSVGPDVTETEIAKLMLAHGISAVPVVDAGGVPLGMVSEGDLIGRDDAGRAARRDWWLDLLAEGEKLNPEFLAQICAHKRSAREIMATPVISVNEETGVAEIARLLVSYRIKRVPVLRDGKIVGIVSRSDLLRAVASVPESAGSGTAPAAPGLFAAIDRHFFRGQAEAPAPAPVKPTPGDQGFTVDDFRHLVGGFKHAAVERRVEAKHEEVEHRHELVQELIDKHIADHTWQGLLHEARVAAGHGDKEFMLLRFPSELCSDRGRAINLPEPGWPDTLRGEAAEIYLRWQRDLHPRGFRLVARVLDFPGGFPGDIGLFLIWGE